MKKILICLAYTSLAFSKAPELVSHDDPKATAQAKTLRWKACAFAGTVLLAIVAGITVIVLDGGTPNHCHPHKDQHPHKDHHPDHPPLHPHHNPHHHTDPFANHCHPHPN